MGPPNKSIAQELSYWTATAGREANRNLSLLLYELGARGLSEPIELANSYPLDKSGKVILEVIVRLEDTTCSAPSSPQD